MERDSTQFVLHWSLSQAGIGLTLSAFRSVLSTQQSFSSSISLFSLLPISLSFYIYLYLFTTFMFFFPPLELPRMILVALYLMQGWLVVTIFPEMIRRLQWYSPLLFSVLFSSSYSFPSLFLMFFFLFCLSFVLGRALRRLVLRASCTPLVPSRTHCKSIQ